jgi:hypothetical protein
MMMNESHKLIAGTEAAVKEGWAAFDQGATDKQRYEAAMQQFDFAERVAKAFNGAGADALMALSEQFEKKPTWPPSLTNGEDQRAYGYIREGQKSVVTFIRNCQALVMKGPPAKPESMKQQES